MIWKPDPRLDAARARPGWKEFHRVCGRGNLFFDDIEQTGKRYRCIALILDGFEGGDSMGAETRHRRVTVAEGVGADPVAVIVDAFEKSGRGTPEMRAARDALLGVVVPAMALDDLLG